jgi:uncharacterized coiled-coil protein SlyX
MDQRLETLETKLAHLELAFDELNQVVYEQVKQLEAAHRFIENLQGRIKEIVDQGEDHVYSAEDERPPHY